VHEEESEEEEIEEPSVVKERFVEDPQLLLPQQTYHHMIGRSFGVAFNDRSFLRPESTTSGSDRYYYGSLGTF